MPAVTFVTAADEIGEGYILVDNYIQLLYASKIQPECNYQLICILPQFHLTAEPASLL